MHFWLPAPHVAPHIGPYPALPGCLSIAFPICSVSNRPRCARLRFPAHLQTSSATCFGKFFSDSKGRNISEAVHAAVHSSPQRGGETPRQSAASAPATSTCGESSGARNFLPPTAAYVAEHVRFQKHVVYIHPLYATHAVYATKRKHIQYILYVL